MIRCIAGAIALVFAAAAPALAQTESREPDIVVVGERLEEMVRAFVGEVAEAPESESQMARWDQKICPLIAGLPARQMQYIADRIAQRAHQIGLRTRAPGCRPNILVLITPDANRLAEHFAEEYRSFIGYYSTNGYQTLGRSALEQFAQSSAPVRWWFVNETMSIDGAPMSSDMGAPELRTTTPVSRLRRTTQQDFSRVLVIVDAQQAHGTTMQALADYVAMVSLAQLDPEGETTGVPTILNLFAARDAGAASPAAMTEWDEAYLDGLYNAQRAAPNDLWQRRQIASRMAEHLDPAN